MQARRLNDSALIAYQWWQQVSPGIGIVVLSMYNKWGVSAYFRRVLEQNETYMHLISSLWSPHELASKVDDNEFIEAYALESCGEGLSESSKGTHSISASQPNAQETATELQKNMCQILSYNITNDLWETTVEVLRV